MSRQRIIHVLGLVCSFCASGLVAGDAYGVSKSIYDESADGRALIESARVEAEREGKLLLVTWGANWCGWCQQLEGVFQNDARVRELADKYYVRVHIDMGSRDKHMVLAREYGMDFDNLYISMMTVHNAEGQLLAQLAISGLLTGEKGAKSYSPVRIARALAIFAPTAPEPAGLSRNVRSSNPYDERLDGATQLAKAQARAVAEGKHVLVVWGADWCGWCKYLAGVFDVDPALRALVRDEFVKISIDVGSRDKNMDVALSLGQVMNELTIPHMTVTDGEGTLLAAFQSRVCGVGPKGEREYSGEKLAEVLGLYVRD